MTAADLAARNGSPLPRDARTPLSEDDRTAVPRVRIRHNDYGSLLPPDLGGWEPRLRVSVVIPAHDCQQALDRTLAGLAAQSYPAHLTEVIVADDGSDPPLRIPELAPANTRLVRVPDGRWGRGWARQTGAASAAGDVLHWVDSDMILDREHLEAHMRWHHLTSYAVVLGDVRFTTGEDGPSAQEVSAAVQAGDTEKLFDGSAPHTWRADVLEETRWLRDAGAGAYRLHSGATTSVPLALLRGVGGVNTALNMGEDTDLGFRLAQAGAVFIPDPQARAWHLGPSTVMLREKEVHRHNWSVLPDLIPDLRWLRSHPRRHWLVPYVHVVVDAHGASYEDVRATVDSALAGTLVDVAVTVVGPWPALTGGRRSSLDEPLLEARLVRNLYGHEPRVSFTEETPHSSAPAPFRLTCPAGWAFGAESLAGLVKLAEDEEYGLLSAALEEGGTGIRAARLERTAAFARAALVDDGTDDLDGVVHELFGSFWVSADELGVTAAGEAEPVAGDPARWRASSARWKREAERLKGEVESLRAENERLRAEAGQVEDAQRRGPLRGIIATAMRHGKTA
ncbi:glycosyltransferase involved in cell wall biosynthesis [Streptosporangium album]|uniref:Glycosyltransferase involved in cell wall biosynthesis n=1 Tax=Streptosporangium album TaxID=47479 RepID=A0A7W7RZF6_9ACTN|nr:glycosyltransferase [Streptosporangium album]MBB4940181.1 glycosyltransferase involved in cell wall biosynthesis [Streptosporangium album]